MGAWFVLMIAAKGGIERMQRMRFAREESIGSAFDRTDPARATMPREERIQDSKNEAQ